MGVTVSVAGNPVVANDPVVADTMDLGRRGGATRLQDMGEGRLGVVLLAVSFDDLQGVDRADVETGAQPVAVDLPDKDSFVLAVQGQGAFSAGRRAQPAAVA